MVGDLPVGDPSDRATEIGPLVTRRQQERVRGFIEEGEREGARLVVGGAGQPEGLDTGWYVQPTLFADVDNGMRIAREEIFGPVLSVIPYGDDDDAVRIANDSDYGLSGLGVDRRRRPGTGGGPPGAHRVVRRQPALQHGSRRPVRRHEGQRHRARARAARASRATSRSRPSPSPRQPGRPAG